MTQNKGIKIFLFSVILFSLTLFLVLNISGLLVEHDHNAVVGEQKNVLAWQSRPQDLVILMFFLIGGALASLRVLPKRTEENDE